MATLSEKDLAKFNISNLEELIAHEIQYNDPNQLGLRLFVRTENYFRQSVFSEIPQDWPIYPFFNPSVNLKERF